MKQLIITMTMIATMISSCSGNKTTEPTFTTDSVKYENKEKLAEVTIKADYPKGNNQVLVNAIAEYISEELGGTFNGDLNDAQAVVDYYGNEATKDIVDYAKDFGTEDIPPLTSDVTFKKIYETDKFVTYTYEREEFMGGAHGSYTCIGTTFRKSDGRKFGIEMLRDIDSDGFHQIVKEGLKEYFATEDNPNTTDEELKSYLITDHDVNYLPIPVNSPYLTEKGLTFAYQQYEIAPYAAGLPTFTVGYDKIKPYLTQTALQYIGQ